MAARRLRRVSLQEVVSYAESFLEHRGFPDFPGAHNGLQLENSGEIRRIVAAVDSHEKVIASAAKEKHSLLLVHHGLGWKPPFPLTGVHGRKVRCAYEGDLAVFSSHLPLDAHPEIGNNALLARALGLRQLHPCFPYQGRCVGWMGRLNRSLDQLEARINQLYPLPCTVLRGGGHHVEKVAVVTGSAGSASVSELLATGCDTLVTGEGPHHTYGDALEAGVNVIHAGHYQTEMAGLQALAAHLSQKFGLPWRFLDFPSGL